MRFVPIKSVEQQAAMMLHRTRALLLRQRTQLISVPPPGAAFSGSAKCSRLGLSISAW
jgi:hypothetical protein